MVALLPVPLPTPMSMSKSSERDVLHDVDVKVYTGLVHRSHHVSAVHAMRSSPFNRNERHTSNRFGPEFISEKDRGDGE